MLTRIRNAILVSKREVHMPHSNIKQSVAEILQANGFLSKVSSSGDGIEKSLNIVINEENKNAQITEISRLSRPGKRMYARSSDIPMVKRGRGIVIVSTSKGVMTGDAAKKANIGGELICKVY